MRAQQSGTAGSRNRRQEKEDEEGGGKEEGRREERIEDRAPDTKGHKNSKPQSVSDYERILSS